MEDKIRERSTRNVQVEEARGTSNREVSNTGSIDYNGMKYLVENQLQKFSKNVLESKFVLNKDFA